VKSVEAIKTSALDEIMNTLQKSIENANVELEKYENIKKAKSLTEKELEELFEIKASAESYVALVNAQVKMKADFNKESQEKKAKLDAELDLLKKNVEEYRANWVGEKERREEALQVELTRTREEWEYNFEREKLMKENELKDTLSQERKAFDENCQIQTASLEAREEKIAQQMLEIEKASKENESLKTQAEEAYAKGLAEGKKKEAKSNEYAIQYLKKEHSSAEALLQAQITSLQANLDRALKENETLLAKIDIAYGRIENISSAQMTGFANSMNNRKSE
jgi:hypothetical protein